MGAPIDLTGQRFGRLVAINPVSEDRKRKWNCICDCGNETRVMTNDLRKGHTQSCGCIHKEFVKSLRYKHGMSETRTHHIWKGMIARCFTPTNKAWRDYGGRGIRVCERWMEFSNFLADMGEAGNEMTIERINVNGNYEPNNCRWATRKEQNRNRRDNRFICAKGMTGTLAEWAEKTGIHPMTILWRLENGWSPDDAVTKRPMTNFEIGVAGSENRQRDESGRFV